MIDARRFICRHVLALAVGIILIIPAVCGAQEASGKILGTVTDPQGAVIPGASVTIINVATRVPRETVTDATGNFLVVSLPLGTYQVAVESAGFKKSMSDSNDLHLNQSLRIDMVLQIGATSETVMVEGAVAATETVNSTLGQSVTSRPLVNLPLNGRNVMQLALLQPGVSEGTGRGLFSVAGGRDDSVTYLLDGGLNNSLLDNMPVYTPNPDTVAEFRILTSNYTAEYGRNGAGVVSVVTKSGTNGIHGSAFEFLRNDALNANTFFNNRDGLPKEVLKRNQFGFTVGGPVVIPGVVNGRDKFFFFGSYQGQRLVDQEYHAAVPVPTPAELAGDFSKSNSDRTGPAPGVVGFLQQFPYFQPNPALAARGIIDPSRISSVAQKYISNKLMPTSPTGSLRPGGRGTDNRDELTARVDAVFTAKDRLSVTLGANRNPNLQPFDLTTAPGFGSLWNNHNYMANISYTRIFSPAVLNEFRFTAQRNNTLKSAPAADLPKPNALGIGITSDHPTGPTRMEFDGGLIVGGSYRGPTTLINNTFSLSDTFSWVKGKHSLKFGATFSPYQNNTLYDYYVNGGFFIGADEGFTDNEFADFFMGLPYEYTQFPEAPSNIRSKSYAGFAQDEWRVTKRLTLTLGIRYEYNQPKFDTQGRSFSLQWGAQSTVFPGAPRGLLFPGDPNAPNGANFPDRNDWAPRFGFAWDPSGNGKTSIRGGFGVFYDILKGEDNLQFNGQAPFFGFADMYFDPLSANPSAELNYFTQPFVATGTPNSFPSKPPTKNLDFDAAGFIPFGGSSVYFVDPHLRTPYTYQYNLSIQRELTRNLTLETNYVGSASHKLTTLVDRNPFVLGTTHRLFSTQPGTTDSSFSYMDSFCNLGHGSYNSLEASLQKRNSDVKHLGTTYFTLAYTYAHGLDNSSGFRNWTSNVPAYSPNQFYGSSDMDIRHRMTFAGGWDLPFDQAWASGPKRLTKGWSLYPILSWRTGFDDDIYAGLSRNRTRPGPSAAGDAELVHPNVVGNSIVIYDPKKPQSFNNNIGNYWFSPANFSAAGLSATSLDPVTNPALRTYGTLGRNSYYGPGRFNLDLSLSKTTPLVGERVGMEFRVEAFNALNNVQFRLPSHTFKSNSLGQITSTYDPRIMQFAVRFTF